MGCGKCQRNKFNIIERYKITFTFDLTDMYFYLRENSNVKQNNNNNNIALINLPAVLIPCNVLSEKFVSKQAPRVVVEL